MPSLEAVGTTYNVGLSSEGAMYDLNLNERARFGHTPETKFIRADRAKLRQWLMTDVVITWNKRFARYKEDKDGVTAFFEDGSSVKGDILVGADGIGSKGKFV
jgi:2-polyprenyl-6-methoxyphenol hydroxylase-like FAD-dependent oxidoreductase